ncbi:hypothetical protein PFISCL1PPCAC_16644, partial [Pristionchus fissidentatus]
FASLFYGDFAERRNGTFELGDVDFERFDITVRFNRFWKKKKNMKNDSKRIIFKLYLIQTLMDRIQQKIMRTKYFTREEKKTLADEYSLILLDAHLSPSTRVA